MAPFRHFNMQLLLINKFAFFILTKHFCRPFTYLTAIPLESNKLFLVQFSMFSSLNRDHEVEVLPTHFAFIQTNSQFQKIA